MEDDSDKNSDKDKDKKKNTTSYTGGESSGMAVINPDIDELMKKAQKNSKTPEQFEKEEKSKDGSVCKITLYKNGYVVDDGQFCDYNEPKNKDFMKQLNKGMIPKTLREKYPNGGLSISLSDKTEETYTPPPPPPYTAFSGQGVTFQDSKPTTKFIKKNMVAQNFILEPNRQHEVTTMRVRLSNGTTITMEANLDSSLQDVYNHISTVSGISTFQLFGGFPPKPLEMTSTVEKSDLISGTLIQK